LGEGEALDLFAKARAKRETRATLTPVLCFNVVGEEAASAVALSPDAVGGEGVKA
jgi:hypothetical protein